MPRLIAPAIVCSVLAHGEHGAVARLLTREAGLLAGYVRGGRSRRLKPVLVPGNAVQAEFRARTEEQLAQLTVELEHSRAPLLDEPLASAAIDWVTGVSAAALPEGQPYPELYDALGGVLDAVEAAPAARGWAQALVRFELLLLERIGFGLDLSRCVASGSGDDLAFVSRRNGGAVSRGAGTGHEDRLLRLPAFVIGGGEGDWDAIFDGLALTGHFLARSPVAERRGDVMETRRRLVTRLQRVRGG
ncbi:MAG: DNA repair protein RecO [Sphingomonadales bacterium]|nr:DNA repair protein RecO [Sphingomonadales bacterium]